MDTVEQLKQYLLEHPPNKKKSKLDPVVDELQNMKSQGYSYREMVNALECISVKAYPSEIKRYLDRKSSVKASKKTKKLDSSTHTVSKFIDSEPKG